MLGTPKMEGGKATRSAAAASDLWPAHMYPDAHISSLGLDGDAEARRLLRQALRDSWPAAKHFGWKVGSLCEMEPHDKEVGYSAEDGTLFVKVRDPARIAGRFYSYGFILATLLHELTHFSILGHGKAFYRRLVEAVSVCGADFSVRHEVRRHICGELLNAICDNDARRARALLTVLPEAVACRSRVGSQLPLEYAAHHGRVALTKLLLKAKADPDSASQTGGVPPLARAAARGNCKTAQLLLEAGAVRGRDALKSVGSLILTPTAPQEGTDDRPELVGPKSCRERPRGAKPRRSESLPALASRAPSAQSLLAATPETSPAGQLLSGKAARRLVTLSGSLAL